MRDARLELQAERTEAGPHLRLTDRTADRVWADAPGTYMLQLPNGQCLTNLQNVRIRNRSLGLEIVGDLGGSAVRVIQRFTLAPKAPFFEERITLHDRAAHPLEATDVKSN